MDIGLEILGLFISAGIVGLLFKKIGNYFASKVKNEYWRGVVDRIDDAALKAVKLVYQAYVGPIKKQGRSLNDQEKIIAKERGRDEIHIFNTMDIRNLDRIHLLCLCSIYPNRY